ncbi:MAG: D-alanine--D-alanine ligase family protein [Oscillospiraceae bacterium]|nr:D-alanine--D-alanine ligase family protein [Oscillospiraceae bacterium]
MKKKIALIFGGVSSEHEISRVSAACILEQLPPVYDVVKLGITKEGRWLYYPGGSEAMRTGAWAEDPGCTPAFLSPDRSLHGLVRWNGSAFVPEHVDVVFPVLHGKNGEDGTIQGVFQMAQIPFVGCGVLSSAVCMDKAITHTILDQAGIPNAMWADVYPWDLDDFDELEAELSDTLGYPMFIKPANAGSSVGVSKAVDKTALLEGLKLAFQHDGKAIVEEFIKGREVECAVFGNHGAKASVLGEIAPKKEFYDYEAKYEDDSTDLYIPARIPAETADLVRELALAAFESLGCEGLARVDFFVQDDGIILNEVNTLPGFTGISMYPKLMMEGGMSPYDLVGGLIELAFQK